MTTRDWVASTQLGPLSDGAAVTDSNIMPVAVSGLTGDTTLAGGGALTKDATNQALNAVNNTSGVARFDLIQGTASAMLNVLMKVTLPTTNPAADTRFLELMDNAGSSMLRLNHLAATGQVRVFDAANASKFTTTADMSGTIYVLCAVQPDTTTTGKIRFYIYDSTFALIANTTYEPDNVNVGLLANGGKTVRMARINTITDTGNIKIHYVRVNDSQITALGPIAAPPTLNVFEGTTPLFEYDATDSVAGGGGALTYSIVWTSGPNNSGGIREPVDGWFFIPQGTLPSTYTITVTESGNTDSQVVTVPAISSSRPSGSIRLQRWNGTILV